MNYDQERDPYIFNDATRGYEGTPKRSRAGVGEHEYPAQVDDGEGKGGGADD